MTTVVRNDKAVGYNCVSWWVYRYIDRFGTVVRIYILRVVDVKRC